MGEAPYEPKMLPGFEKPYGAVTFEELPFWDFNREIVPPGSSETFPNGAIGVRVDDDFWVVAALPYQEYLNVPIEAIVARLWPECVEATFGPDSGLKPHEVG